LIGMAALFAGASRAWLTSIAFSLETTGQMNGLLPLLGACLAAYFISFFLMKGSIMTEKINRRGVRTPDAYEPDTLQGISVSQLMTPVTGPDAITAAAALPACDAADDVGLAAEMLGQYGADTIAVKDEKEEGKIVGTITARSILHFYSLQRQKEQDYQSPARTRRMMVHGRKILRTHKN
jgi:CIC family chloride channel protein